MEHGGIAVRWSTLLEQNMVVNIDNHVFTTPKNMSML